MSEYFQIKNWDTFQHYHDRNPPWIKLYNKLFEDFEFENLDDNSKLHLILIWLLASRTNNKIPYNNKWVKKKIGVDSNVDLNILLKAGYIHKLPNEINDASKKLADCYQDASTERETEREERERNRVLEATEDYSKLACSAGLKKVRKITNGRKSSLIRRLDDCKKMNITFRDVLNKVNESSFLKGDNDRKWRADFDFIITESSFIKIVEGKYDNRSGRDMAG